MLVKLDNANTVRFPFSTRDPATGNRADATSTTATVELNGANVTGTDIAVVKKAATTGQYNVVLTIDTTNFVAGNIYTIRVEAEVNGVTDEAPIASFEVSVETHGVVIDKSIASVETNIVNAGNAAWATATDINSVGTVTNPVTVGTNNDKFGYRLDATGIQGVWEYATPTIGAGKNTFELLCLAVAFAGGGTVSATDQGAGDVAFDPADWRDETFVYPDGTTDAATIRVDRQGIRQSVNLL